MTSTSSATVFTDLNTTSSVTDVVSVSTNEALIIQTDPSGTVVEEHSVEITETSSPKCVESKTGQPLSSSSSSRDDVKEVDPRDRRLVYVSGLQLVLGALVLVWGGAVVSHEASLGPASAAAAFIGGLTALAAGVAGFAARRSKRRNKSAHIAATSTVALSAVALAACSLVMALSATGLLRDGGRPTQQVTWGALLANTGLLLTSGLLTAACVVSGALWRRDAGVCTSRRPSARPVTVEPLPGTPPAPHKHKLVSKWLGQQQGGGPALFMIAPMPGSGHHHAGSVYSGHSAPHIIPLHVPPPPLSMQPYILPGPPPPCVLHGPSMTLPHQHKERRRSRHHRRRSSSGEVHGSPVPALLPPMAGLQEVDSEAEARLAAVASKRQRLPSALTEEEMERSYTGLDRAIAEDFITNTMEKHHVTSRRTSEEASRDMYEHSSHF